MGAREELEARLQASWSTEDLAVYADALLADGDVRGELIALDLHREPRPLPIKRSRQRLALLARWLGDDLAEPAYDLTRYGFVHTRPDAGESLLPVLDRVGPYVRSIDFLAYRHDEIRALIQKLSLATLPWLGRLSLTVNGEATRRGPIIDDELAAELIAATPSLAALELEARDAFVSFPHPSVTHLRSSHRGIRTLSGENAVPIPSLVELDLALSERFDWAPLPPATAPRLLPPAALPALTHLDLSRNEPGLSRPFHRGHDNDVYALLDLPICARLTHLRLPALHTDDDRAALERLVARTPVLVEIARGYADMAPLVPLLSQLPRVSLPSPWPWPPSTTRTDRISFREYGFEIKVQALLASLEQHHDAMPAPARAAWATFWSLLSTSAREAQLSSDDFETIVRSLPEAEWGHLPVYISLRHEAEEAPETVTIVRFVR